MHFDLLSLILSFGYIGIATLVFVESGLLIGFFLPGDSVLFSVGLLASRGLLNIWILVPLVCVAAITGDSVGYFLGTKIGPSLFQREDSKLFKKQYVLDTHRYFEKYGPITLVLARFLPVIRTFAPVLAGIGSMKYRQFIAYNIIGGLLWGACIPLLGYFLGATIPGIDKYIYPIILGIIVLSALPVFIQWFKSRK